MTKEEKKSKKSVALKGISESIKLLLTTQSESMDSLSMISTGVCKLAPIKPEKSKEILELASKGEELHAKAETLFAQYQAGTSSLTEIADTVSQLGQVNNHLLRIWADVLDSAI